MGVWVVYDYGHNHGHMAAAPPMSRMMKASEFKAKCLALMDEVERTGESVVITKNGKPIAELSPYKQRKRNARGILKGRLVVTGDIISPVDVEWKALK